jgi:hypothetical protein
VSGADFYFYFLKPSNIFNSKGPHYNKVLSVHN